MVCCLEGDLTEYTSGAAKFCMRDVGILGQDSTKSCSPYLSTRRMILLYLSDVTAVNLHVVDSSGAPGVSIKDEQELAH